MLQHALWYAGRGMAVFPLHTNSGGYCSCGWRDCHSPAKHPRTINGCKDATADKEQIQKWWGMWPDSNIGLATGSVSGIVVLDIDNDKERGIWGSETLREWEEEQGSLPPTWTSLTGGGGIHYIYRLPEGKTVGNRAKMLEGMDCRGDGGYIVAPPSLHISGQHYTWDADGDPAEVNPALLPDALFRLMRRYADEPGQVFTLPTAVPDGIRNDTLFKLACSLRAKGLSESAIFAATMEENRLRCSPPKDEREVRTICSSASRYAPGDFIDKAEDEAKAIATATQAAQEGDFTDITSLDTMKSIYAIRDIFERQTRINQLRDRATKLHKKTEFDRSLAAYRRQYISQRNNATARPIQITDCPVAGLRCSRWNATDSGVRRINVDNKGDEREEVAANQPIVISERLKNIDTLQEKVKIEYLDKKTGSWQSVIVPKTTIANRAKIVDLSGAGIDVTSESAKYLVQYLNDLENASTDVIPSYKSIGRLGWLPDKTFSPYMDEIKFDGQAQYKELFEATRPHGDAAAWAPRALQLRGESTIARIALAASFASPLVYLLKKLPFFVHFWGGTEIGKTVSTMMAMSVWGDPALGKLVRSFDGTAVGLERLAAFYHSVPLALDELQTIKKSRVVQNDFDQIIYKLGEGQGRIRGTRDGGVEQMGYWRLCVLSSGEEPITTFRSGGGAKNRVIEIYCTEKAFRDAPAAADFAQGCYGHAGPVYIQALQDCSPSEIGSRYEFWYRYFNEDKGKTEKQSMAAAMLCAADYFSSIYVFGLPAPDTDRFAESLSDLMALGDEIDVIERAWESVCGWIASNQGRFDFNASEKGECYGKQVSSGEYQIIATVFNDVIQEAGFSPRRCLPAFAEKGYIETWLEEKTDGTLAKRYSKKARIGNSAPRCVVVKLGDLSIDDGLTPAPFQ